MNFTPNFAGIINALKHIIENGVASGGGSGGGGATATKQDEQTGVLNTISNSSGATNTNLSAIGVVIGGTNSTPATSDTGDWNLNALIKRMLQRQASLLPQSLVLSATVNTTNTTVFADTLIDNYSNLSLHLSGTWNATIIVQGNNNIDTSNWVDLSVAPVNDTTGQLLINLTQNNIYFFRKKTRFIRVIVVYQTSGVVGISLYLSSN